MNHESTDLPSPEFQQHLEWEIERTFRREARLGTRRHEQRRRRMRTLMIVAVCLALGTGSNFAAAQVRDVGRRDSLLEAARAELSVAALRLEMARSKFDLASRQARTGVISAGELQRADADLQVLQAQSARLQSHIDEIRAVSLAPRDELNAPLVSGRDFVKERIQLDMQTAQAQLMAAERTLLEMERQVRVGMATEIEHSQAQLDAARARAALDVIAEKSSLRREFVEKATPAEVLARRLAATQLREDMLIARQSLDVAVARLRTIERQQASGAVTEIELMRAKLDVKEREVEMQRLGGQLKRIGTRRDSMP